MENTQKKSSGKISYTLQIIGLLPLLALGIAMLFFTSQWFTKTMYQEVERELYDATKSATTLLNAAYPGDYHLEGDVAYLLYKGETDITRDYSLLDQFKEDTGLDITLFYQDTRILTTLYNAQGERIVGSGAPDIVIQDVLNTGENHFYTHALINGKAYFSYYIPLRNQDGSVVGMLFVGRPSETVPIHSELRLSVDVADHRFCGSCDCLHLFLHQKIRGCITPYPQLPVGSSLRESERHTGSFRNKAQ